jgi:hypothetical protein
VLVAGATGGVGQLATAKLLEVRGSVTSRQSVTSCALVQS